jgi:hypothetical protein
MNKFIYKWRRKKGGIVLFRSHHITLFFSTNMSEEYRNGCLLESCAMCSGRVCQRFRGAYCFHHQDHKLYCFSTQNRSFTSTVLSHTTLVLFLMLKFRYFLLENGNILNGKGGWQWCLFRSPAVLLENKKSQHITVNGEKVLYLNVLNKWDMFYAHVPVHRGWGCVGQLCVCVRFRESM